MYWIKHRLEDDDGEIIPGIILITQRAYDKDGPPAIRHLLVKVFCCHGREFWMDDEAWPKQFLSDVVRRMLRMNDLGDDPFLNGSPLTDRLELDDESQGGRKWKKGE